MRQLTSLLVYILISSLDKFKPFIKLLGILSIFSTHKSKQMVIRDFYGMYDWNVHIHY